MSGLYNVVFGNTPMMPALLRLLGDPNVGRLRDAWLEKLPDGTLRIAVYTRNGGGNREHYSDDREEGVECGCTGCIITYSLPSHPLYIEDRDDEFDCTYATVYFRVPDNAAALLVEMGAPPDFALASWAVEPVNMSERWQTAIAAIGKKS